MALIKDLLDRIEEQEHDLSENTSCANELSELRKKYNELLERLSSQSEANAVTDWQQHYEILEKQYMREREEWEERLRNEEKSIAERANQVSRHEEIVRRLNRSLQDAEKRIQGLVTELETERAGMSSHRKMADSTETASIRRENQELTKQYIL
ncbi:hypothetical protein SK128_023691 [Halocaridina rubra]|uniref:Uncharacterized protein n=1 Tax=Halocaridina rubra TaxID=373956 RepID=A0AAN8X992_HALRR